MKEDIVYLLFNNWCDSEHEPRIKDAVNEAVRNPTENTVLELVAVAEENAFKAGVRAALKMIHCLFIDEPDREQEGKDEL